MPEAFHQREIALYVLVWVVVSKVSKAASSSSLVLYAEGLVYLVIPQALEALLKVPIKEPEMYRTLGAAVLGFAASSWYAYRETAWDRVRIVVQMEMVWTILGTLVLLWGLTVAGLPAMDWVNAVILGGFAVAFCFFFVRHVHSGA